MNTPITLVEVGMAPRQRPGVPSRRFILGRIWKNGRTWYACTAYAYNSRKDKNAAKKCLLEMYLSPETEFCLKYGFCGLTMEATEKLLEGKVITWS